MEFTFTSLLWEWQGKGAWCFVSLPQEYYEVIKQLSAGAKKGFGSVRVVVQVGSTTWRTSVFPDSRTKTFLLPIKKEVRSKEALGVDSLITVHVRLADV
jgi:Domain of unknown function (DUF1905)